LTLVLIPVGGGKRFVHEFPFVLYKTWVWTHVLYCHWRGPLQGGWNVWLLWKNFPQ